MPARTKRDPEVEAEMLDRISHGETLTAVCKSSARYPSVQSFLDWVDEDEALAKSYSQARTRGYDAMAQQCIEIADNVRNDDLVGDNGVRPNHEWMARSKLRVETRLKLLSKWAPQKYGDVLKVMGDKDNPLMIKNDTAPLVAELMQVLQVIVQPQPQAKQIEEKK
jgi:hypothetical protein